MIDPPPDPAKAAAFAQRMTDVLNNAFLALMVSIGQQTELFETLAHLPPSTCEVIAQAARLQERYVREWLGAMVVGRILDYDPATLTYALPPEHAACLTRAAGADNLATFMRWVSCQGAAEPQVVECFRHGGGVPYEAYAGFHALMRAESAQTLETTLIEHVLPVVPGLVQRLGQGLNVLDAGCGSGHAVNLMARSFPRSHFTGYDFAAEGIAAARAEASAWGLTNTEFVVQDLATMRDQGCFDLITAFDAIHDQAQPRQVLANIGAALRPRGYFLLVDVGTSSLLHENLDHPLGPWVGCGSRL